MLQLSSTLLILLCVSSAAFALFVFVAKIPFRYNLRNLAVRWRTTVLTGLAFTLVIALLTVMMAFVNGMYQLTETSGHPGNVIILSDGATDESFSNLSFADASDVASQPGIARIKGQAFCSRETYLVVNQPIQGALPGRPKRRFLQLRGIENPSLSAAIHGLSLQERGQWFSPAGVRELAGSPPGAAPAIEAVLGEGIARELARDRDPGDQPTTRQRERLEVGDTFSLGERIWFVTGILRSSGSTFASEVWAKRGILGPMFGKENHTSLVIRADDTAAAIQLRDFFNTQYRKSALQAQLESDYFASLAGTNRQFLVAIVFISIVMAMGGVFGVMNTMFAAVSQRTNDIGVLRLLGFSRWQILASFLIESLVIALVGGLVGCALGSLVDGWSATSMVGSGHGGGGKFVVLELAVNTNAVVLGILLALGMGAVGGLLPAISAVRLRPLDALR